MTLGGNVEYAQSRLNARPQGYPHSIAAQRSSNKAPQMHTSIRNIFQCFFNMRLVAINPPMADACNRH